MSKKSAEPSIGLIASEAALPDEKKLIIINENMTKLKK